MFAERKRIRKQPEVFNDVQKAIIEHKSTFINQKQIDIWQNKLTQLKEEKEVADINEKADI